MARMCYVPTINNDVYFPYDCLISDKKKRDYVRAHVSKIKYVYVQDDTKNPKFTFVTIYRRS